MQKTETSWRTDLILIGMFLDADFSSVKFQMSNFKSDTKKLENNKKSLAEFHVLTFKALANANK